MGLSNSGSMNQDSPDPGVDYSAANQQAGNLANTQAATFDKSNAYNSGVLSGTQPSAAAIAGKNQTGMMHAANAAQAGSARGAGAGNATKNAMSANATGDAAIAGGTAAGTAAEKATAAGGLANAGYMQGQQQLGEQGQQAQQAMTPAQLQLANRGQNMQAAGQNQQAFGNLLGGIESMFDADLKEPPRADGKPSSHVTLREEPWGLLMVNHATGEMGKIEPKPLTAKEHAEARGEHGAGPIDSPNRMRTEVGDLKIGNPGDSAHQHQPFAHSAPHSAPPRFSPWAQPREPAHGGPGAAGMSGGLAHAGDAARDPSYGHYPGAQEPVAGDDEAFWDEAIRSDSGSQDDPRTQEMREKQYVGNQMQGKYEGPHGYDDPHATHDEADWKAATGLSYGELGGGGESGHAAASQGAVKSNVPVWRPPTGGGGLSHSSEYSDMANTPNSHGQSYDESVSTHGRQSKERDDGYGLPGLVMGIPRGIASAAKDVGGWFTGQKPKDEENPHGGDIDMGGGSDPFASSAAPDASANHFNPPSKGKGGLGALMGADIEMGGGGYGDTGYSPADSYQLPSDYAQTQHGQPPEQANQQSPHNQSDPFNKTEQPATAPTSSAKPPQGKGKSIKGGYTPTWTKQDPNAWEHYVDPVGGSSGGITSDERSKYDVRGYAQQMKGVLNPSGADLSFQKDGYPTYEGEMSPAGQSAAHDAGQHHSYPMEGVTGYDEAKVGPNGKLGYHDPSSKEWYYAPEGPHPQWEGEGEAKHRAAPGERHSPYEGGGLDADVQGGGQMAGMASAPPGRHAVQSSQGRHPAQSAPGTEQNPVSVDDVSHPPPESIEVMQNRPAPAPPPQRRPAPPPAPVQRPAAPPSTEQVAGRDAEVLAHQAKQQMDTQISQAAAQKAAQQAVSQAVVKAPNAAAAVKAPLQPQIQAQVQPVQPMAANDPNQQITSDKMKKTEIKKLGESTLRNGKRDVEANADHSTTDTGDRGGPEQREAKRSDSTSGKKDGNTQHSSGPLDEAKVAESPKKSVQHDYYGAKNPSGGNGVNGGAAWYDQFVGDPAVTQGHDPWARVGADDSRIHAADFDVGSNRESTPQGGFPHPSQDRMNGGPGMPSHQSGRNPSLDWQHTPTYNAYRENDPDGPAGSATTRVKHSGGMNHGGGDVDLGSVADAFAAGVAHGARGATPGHSSVREPQWPMQRTRQMPSADENASYEEWDEPMREPPPTLNERASSGMRELGQMHDQKMREVAPGREYGLAAAQKDEPNRALAFLQKKRESRGM